MVDLEFGGFRDSFASLREASPSLMGLATVAMPLIGLFLIVRGDSLQSNGPGLVRRVILNS